jgi:hypothetical protein
LTIGIGRSFTSIGDPGVKIRLETPIFDGSKSEYSVDEIPGINVADRNVWLNLDWYANYPGGPYFEGERAVSLIIDPEKKVVPKIIPVIDDMESAEGWETSNDGKGSSISINPTIGRMGNGLEISYDLKEGGWVGISRKIVIIRWLIVSAEFTNLI